MCTTTGIQGQLQAWPRAYKKGVDNFWLVTNTLSKITIIFQGIFRKLVKVTSHTTANLPQTPAGFEIQFWSHNHTTANLPQVPEGFTTTVDN